jgi:hypothetical protein
LRGLAFKGWLLLVLVAPPLTFGQSLGEAAAKEKERRGGHKDQAKTYTNEDLPKKTASQGVVNAAASSYVPPDTSPTQSRPTEADAKEAGWRSRAGAARGAVKSAEAKAESLDSESRRLLTERLESTDTNEILRLQAEQQSVNEQLEAAKQENETAKKGLADLLEAARREGIPSAWLEPKS